MGLEIINERKKELGLTSEELSRKSNVPAGTLNKILSGATKDPKLDTLKSIARVLGLSLNDFDDSSDNSCKLSASEYTLIEKYRKLDDHGEQIVTTVLDLEYDRCLTPAVMDNVRPIRYYQRTASAGPGQVLFDDIPVDLIEIPDIDDYRRVAYAVGVNGDSMEPEYHDSDILLVEPAVNLMIGEIGIFYVDGNTYVKELGHGELLSFNPDYDPIPLNEDSRCMGRVVGKL